MSTKPLPDRLRQAAKASWKATRYPTADLLNEAADAIANAAAPPARLKELVRVLYSTLVRFHEHKQEFYCTVCHYRDPLVDGDRLHDDNCPLAAVMDAIGAFEHLPKWPLLDPVGDGIPR